VFLFILNVYEIFFEFPELTEIFENLKIRRRFFFLNFQKEVWFMEEMMQWAFKYNR
jgi:hypothetical protein